MSTSLSTKTAIFTLSISFSLPVFADAADFGPLLIRSQAPLQSNGVNSRIRDASATRGGEVFLSGSMASIWAENGEYRLDYYQNDVTGGVQFSINPTLKAELSYLYRYADNNHLDSLTMEFHDLFGLSQNGREGVAKHQFEIDIPNETISDFDGETLANVMELYLEQSLYENSANALSLGLTLHYNRVSDGPFKNTAFEQAMQLNYTGRIAQAHTFYTSFNINHRAHDDFTDIKLKEWTVNGGISYQYRPTFNHSVLLEYRIHEGEAVSLADLKESAHEFALGYRYHFFMSAFELAVVENLINMDNSADIAFTVSFRQRF